MRERLGPGAATAAMTFARRGLPRAALIARNGSAPASPYGGGGAHATGKAAATRDRCARLT